MVASGRHRGQRGCRDVDDDTESEYRGRLFSDSARCVDSSRAQSHPPWAVACVRQWGSIVLWNLSTPLAECSCASFPSARACRVRLVVTDERSDGPYLAHVVWSDAVRPNRYESSILNV